MRVIAEQHSDAVLAGLGGYFSRSAPVTDVGVVRACRDRCRETGQIRCDDEMMMARAGLVVPGPGDAHALDSELDLNRIRDRVYVRRAYGERPGAGWRGRASKGDIRGGIFVLGFAVGRGFGWLPAAGRYEKRRLSRTDGPVVASQSHTPGNTSQTATSANRMAPSIVNVAPAL